ncbi:MAG: YafY family transcriptional regulator [Clostridia bacterium]|nr:YafY family transcriptional regulator [Clostridia bacterium]
MKLERMLSIITYLLNHDKVKAKDLADKFEVSVRTIYRDIDAISQAGIPIAAYQGADGGIGIVEGYKLDKSLLTTDEVSNIVTALKGLHSINEDDKIKLLIEKLTNIANRSDYIPTGNEIMIDLSSWNKNDQLGLRIHEIKKAIRERKIIEFEYFSNEKVTERKVEPCIMVFKEASWYLYAYCLLREDFRLFKLRRMSGLKITGTSFKAREFSVDSVNWDEDIDKDLHSTIVVLFDKSMEYSVNDIFGIANYETIEDGRLKVTFHMTVGGWLYGFLLGFGDKIEVLEPIELRDKIKSIAESIRKVYE